MYSQNFRSRLPLVLLSALALGRASAVENPPTLDTVVVTAGPDAKTAFDLAQGTSVLAGDELRRRAQSTLGETLAATPGVNSTAYGPGASRPIIRGLGGDRVRVLGDGVGALDASNVSPDHQTALEPLFASRIEVLRGPATLLYGGSAIGGVVNVLGRRLPATAPDGRLHGAFEARGLGASDERTALLSLDGGARDGLGVHLEALQQKTSDLAIPGVARIDADAPAAQPRGTLPGSATATWSGALGLAKFWTGGRLAAALSDYETVYGVPTGDSPPTSINLKQRRLDLEGELTRPVGVFRGAHARFGVADYDHAELGGTQVNTIFRNRAWEARLELPHAALGALTGTLGAQASRSAFSAVGDEVATPPSVTTAAAVFAVEEIKLSPATALQFGARFDAQSVALGEVAPGLPALRGYSARSGRRREFGALSASAGVVTRPAADWSLAASLAWSGRPPTAQELFSHGPHGGTAAWEIGTGGLGVERALGLDLSLRRRAGFVTGSLGVFVNRFTGYVFEQELPLAVIPAALNPTALTPYQFIARAAAFRGAEAELLFHLVDRPDLHLHLALTADTVRAEETATGAPLPRIPPSRVGAAVHLDLARFSAVVETRTAAAQRRHSAAETATAGYTLLHASVAWTIPAGDASWEVFLRGANLANTVARAHASFLKEFAPLPGRGVTAGFRASF